MRAIALLVVLGLAAFTNAGSGSDSDSSEYINVDYTGFEKMYVSFASEMAIVFNSTAYDIILKLNEFSIMPGIQPILAMSSLYGDFIPPYAVCRYLINKQVKTLPKLITAPNPNVVNIFFTQDQINTIYSAWGDLENSDVVAIEGIVNRMNGLETMVYDPHFKFNDEYMTMPTKVASNFFNTFDQWIDGNQGVVKAFQKLMDLDINTLKAQQNNPYSQYVLGVIFKFFKKNLDIHQAITDAIKNTVSSVSSSAESSSIYTTKIDSAVNSIMSDGNSLSNQFMELAGICTSMENALVNPPPISSNESS